MRIRIDGLTVRSDIFIYAFGILPSVTIVVRDKDDAVRLGASCNRICHRICRTEITLKEKVIRRFKPAAYNTDQGCILRKYRHAITFIFI